LAVVLPAATSAATTSAAASSAAASSAAATSAATTSAAASSAATTSAATSAATAATSAVSTRSVSDNLVVNASLTVVRDGLNYLSFTFLNGLFAKVVYWKQNAALVFTVRVHEVGALSFSSWQTTRC
jgi:hypothetical protein